MPRAVSAGYPYHITQRGSDQRNIFREDRDRYVYLSLLREAGEKYGVDYEGYCLMSNHVHLIAVPKHEESLHRGLKWAHSAYSRYAHASYGGSGHFWQARFFSCILDGPYHWRALAYVEMNPVRAGIVAAPEEHPWSSARAHLSVAKAYLPLRMETWALDWNAAAWRAHLNAMTGDYLFWRQLREATQTGRPLAEEATLTRLECELGRSLRPLKRGPQAKAAKAGLSEPVWAQNPLEFGD
jgi:putative transposase